MPRFSIIVPSHGVPGHLSQALESVLAQSFGDLELIPVCDSPTPRPPPWPPGTPSATGGCSR